MEEPQGREAEARLALGRMEHRRNLVEAASNALVKLLDLEPGGAGEQNPGT